MLVTESLFIVPESPRSRYIQKNIFPFKIHYNIIFSSTSRPQTFISVKYSIQNGMMHFSSLNPSCRPTRYCSYPSCFEFGVFQSRTWDRLFWTISRSFKTGTGMVPYNRPGRLHSISLPIYHSQSSYHAVQKASLKTQKSVNPCVLLVSPTLFSLI